MPLGKPARAICCALLVMGCSTGASRDSTGVVARPVPDIAPSRSGDDEYGEPVASIEEPLGGTFLIGGLFLGGGASASAFSTVPDNVVAARAFAPPNTYRAKEFAGYGLIHFPNAYTPNEASRFEMFARRFASWRR